MHNVYNILHDLYKFVYCTIDNKIYPYDIVCLCNIVAVKFILTKINIAYYYYCSVVLSWDRYAHTHRPCEKCGTRVDPRRFRGSNMREKQEGKGHSERIVPIKEFVNVCNINQHTIKPILPVRVDCAEFLLW